MTTKELVAYIIGVVLAALALVVGFTTDFLGMIPDPARAEWAAFATSIVVFLVADRIAAAVRDSTVKTAISALFKEAVGSAPQYGTMFEFSTCDDAMEYLCRRLPSAKVALNTKISRDAIPPRRDVAPRYRKAIEAGFKRGLTYREVISSGFESDARELQAAAEGTNGRYSFKIVDVNAPVFLNFIVVDYEDEPDELLIGWATSLALGTEQKAFRVRDDRIVNYFRTYHAELLR